VPTKTHSIFDPAMIFPAIGESFKKLNPFTLARNPVIFVAEVGAATSTILLTTVRDSNFGFQFQITLWIWVIVLGANFAEALAEERGKARARALRVTQTQIFGRRLKIDGTIEKVPLQELRKNDVVIVSAGELIPGDGEVVEGAASVDESAMTGESAPVIRESGSDRSAVTGSTKVLSDQIKIQITSNPGESFVDRMVSLVEGANREKTPNEIALTFLLSMLTFIFLIAVMSMKAFGMASLLNLTVPVLVALLVGLIPPSV
jgi:potassium-transporting ATPase ATP-binding subunit